MNKKIDYLSMYQKRYKSLPNIIFFGSLIFWGLAAIAAGITLFSFARIGDDEITAVFVMLLGLILAPGFAWLSRLVTAIFISQKVVITDTLLSMANDVPSSVSDDDLPDL